MEQFEIANDRIDFARYLLPPEEQARIVTPLSLKDQIIDLSVGKRAGEGLRLPWPRMGNHLRFPPGKVTLVTGKTHHGKTNFLKQLMLHAAAEGERSAIASMEETPDEVLFDMCSMATLERNPDEDWIDVFLAWAENKVWVYDQQNLVKPDHILGVMNYCGRELGVKYFVIDSWMRMDIKDDEHDYHREFINILAMHARSSGVHVFLVVHMTKGDGKEGPQNFETVRGSGNILNQVDIILNVWRNKKPRHERLGGAGGGEPDGLFICEKNRVRPRWIGTIPLWMDAGSGQFIETKDSRPISYLNRSLL